MSQISLGPVCTSLSLGRAGMLGSCREDLAGSFGERHGLSDLCLLLFLPLPVLPPGVCVLHDTVLLRLYVVKRVVHVYFM